MGTVIKAPKELIVGMQELKEKKSKDLDYGKMMKLKRSLNIRK